MSGMSELYAEGIDVTQPAVKHDSDKPSTDLLPFTALIAVSRVMGSGSKKYGPHNWKGGFAWRRLLGAALRHLFDWARGINRDPETGESHLAHAACCVLMLLEHEAEGLGADDRYKR